MSEAEIKDLKEKLLKSHWPKCDDIANQIASYGTKEAKESLLEAANLGQRKHIRTAAVRELSNFNGEDVILVLKEKLEDIAYETREEAKKTLEILKGE